MKICFVCQKCGSIEFNKITSKDTIIREKQCSKCKTPMNFVRQNKKHWKDRLKQQKVD